MILLLGASGYVGQAFAAELQRRGQAFQSVSRKGVDYTRFDVLLAHLRATNPSFVINCAGYTGKPNVDACEDAKADTLAGNTLLPQTVGHACAAAGMPWAQISSGCIYRGAKIATPSGGRVESDLTKPEVRALLATNRAALIGFKEDDEPNFSFRRPPCSFYSGTKALGEEAVRDLPQTYLWRLRIPFDEFDNGRNYLSKIQRYPKVYDNVNSLSHRGDFARACLDLWERRAAFGIYNVTNPGFISTREVITMIEQQLRPGRKFEFWADDAEFYRYAVKTPRSNCVMDVSKLLATGVKMRPVQEALIDALSRWQKEGA